jgi:hypothetical protein
MPEHETSCQSCGKSASIKTSSQTSVKNSYMETATGSKAEHTTISLSTSLEGLKSSTDTNCATRPADTGAKAYYTVPISTGPKTYHTIPIDIVEKEDEEERRRRIAMLDPEFSAPGEEQLSNGAMPISAVADLTTRENIPQLSAAPQFGGDIAGQSIPFQPYAPSGAPADMSQNVEAMGNYLSSAQDAWMPPDAPYSPSMPSTPPQYPIDRGASNQSHRGITWLRLGLIVMLVLLILIFSGMGLSLLASTPTLTLTGNTSVAQGSTLHLNGSHFLPDSTVTLTLDHTTPIYYAYQQPYPTRQTITSNNANVLFVLKNQLTQTSLVNDKIRVGSNGTFSVNIQVGMDWTAGQHTIQATESSGSHIATLSFTIIQQTPVLTQETVTPTSTTIATVTPATPATPQAPAPPAPTPTAGITPTVIVTSLSGITPNAITLGPVNEGATQAASSTITLNTTGTALLTWNAAWDQQQAPWLQLTVASGQIQAPASQKITVSAQPANLKAGTYKALITFTNSLDTHTIVVTVALTVQASCLKVTPGNLNFIGTVGANDPAPQTVTLNNCGPASTWNATVQADSNWLSVTPGSGTIDQNATQTVTVTVAVANQKLAAGTYHGQIQFSSGGSQTTVTVILTVQSVQQLSVDQQKIVVAQTCKSGTGSWTCKETLSSSGAQGELAWTSSSNGNGGVTITPASGTIAAGQTTSVSIVVPVASCASNFALTFAGPTNSINVPVDCGGTQPTNITE